MKTQTVLKKLGHFRNFQDNKNRMVFQSGANLNRIVRVVDHYGMAVALPIFVDQYGTEIVAFSAKTIKQLVDFLNNK
jgi:hypothetical protein